MLGFGDHSAASQLWGRESGREELYPDGFAPWATFSAHHEVGGEPGLTSRCLVNRWEKPVRVCVILHVAMLLTTGYRRRSGWESGFVSVFAYIDLLGDANLELD